MPDNLKAQLLDPAYRAKLLAIEAAIPQHPWRTIEATNEKYAERQHRHYVTATPEGWEPEPLSAYGCIGVWDNDGLTTEAIAELIAAARNNLKAALEIIGKPSDRSNLYSHGEIEAACGGKVALDVRDKVLKRRAKIDAENEMRKAKP